MKMSNKPSQYESERDSLLKEIHSDAEILFEIAGSAAPGDCFGSCEKDSDCIINPRCTKCVPISIFSAVCVIPST